MAEISGPLLDVSRYQRIFENTPRTETREIRTVISQDRDDLKKIAALDANEVTIDTPLELALFHYYINFSGTKNIVSGGELLQRINSEVENPHIGKTGNDPQKIDGLMIGAAVYGELSLIHWRGDPHDIRLHNEMLFSISERYNISVQEIADYYTNSLSAKIDAEIEKHFNNRTVGFRDGNGSGTLQFDCQANRVTLTYRNQKITSRGNTPDFRRALEAHPEFYNSRMYEDVMNSAHLLPSFIYAHEGKLPLINELKTRLLNFLAAPSESSFRKLVQVRRAANIVFDRARVVSDRWKFELVMRSINNRLPENYDLYLERFPPNQEDLAEIDRLARRGG